MSFHELTASLSEIWKLPLELVIELSRTVSSQSDKPLIVITSVDLVKDCKEINFILETNLELWVTPVTKIPIINITIESSIRENAFLILKTMVLSGILIDY